MTRIHSPLPGSGPFQLDFDDPRGPTTSDPFSPGHGWPHEATDGCDFSSPGLARVTSDQPRRVPTGDDVVRRAREKLADAAVRESFAYEAPYRSSNPGIDGTYRKQNKCNLLVGDALHAAGFGAPTHITQEKNVHYRKAEDWPGDTQHFSRVADLKDIRPGDIIVIDRPGTGGSTAHIEIVSKIERDKNGKPASISSIGAHFDGAKELTNYGDDLINAKDVGNRFVTDPSLPPDQREYIYVLRPKTE